MLELERSREKSKVRSDVNLLPVISCRDLYVKMFASESSLAAICFRGSLDDVDDFGGNCGRKGI